MSHSHRPQTTRSEYKYSSVGTDGNDHLDGDPDELVLEMDVFLAPELAQEMHLLQYPIHQRAVPNPTSAKMKPRHGIIEAQYPVHNVLRPRIYSSQTIPVTTHMCLGRIVADGSVHLVPLNHISQMRPSFEHLDEQDLLTNNGAEDAAAANRQDTNAKNPITFQRKESERAAVIRERSHAFKKQSENAEAWIDLDVTTDGSAGPSTNTSTNQPSTSFAAHLARTVCHETENDVFVQEGSLSSYVQSLNYLEQKVDEPDDDSTTGKKVATLLRSGSPIPYFLIRQALPDDDNYVVLNYLSECAVLLRGNWCLKSSYLKMPDDIQNLRSFILLILQDHGMLYRESLVLAYPTSASSNQVLVILRTVAKKTDTCWVPKISDNAAFLQAHPDIALLHENITWVPLRAQFAEPFAAYNDSLGV